MSKRRIHRSLRLSARQRETPETLTSVEIELRRQEARAAAAAERRRTAERLLNEGARLLHAQRPGEALAALQRAHDLAPDDPDVAINLGGALVMSAKWNTAVRFLEGAVTQHPNNARLWLNLAAAHLGPLATSSPMAQDRAIAAFQNALAIDPQTPQAHYNLGLIYTDRRDWFQAAFWFRRALETDPTDRDAAAWLQRAEAAMNDQAPRDEEGLEEG